MGDVDSNEQMGAHTSTPDVFKEDKAKAKKVYHLLQNNYSFDALQAYCFRFYFLLVTVILLQQMV